MKLHLIRQAVPGLCLALALSSTWAQDLQGSRDHPGVSRYPGSSIAHYDYKEFEQAQLILSKPYKRHGEYVADKVLPLEGAVTYIHYQADKSVSAFQLFRNYQSVLRRSGYQELFACERPCIDGHAQDLRKLLGARSLYLNGHEDLQYVAAQRGNTYVSLLVDSMGSSTDAWLFVIDKGQLDDGRMAISGGGAIARALSSQGRVDLYGFYFDTGKSGLQDGSDKTLGELAQVLQDNPQLTIRIVGHTDDVGATSANQVLSSERAQSVAQALTRQYRIDASRLQAQGRGDTQPVAPNTNEDGRARNRRVEIIVLSPIGTAMQGLGTGQAGGHPGLDLGQPAPPNRPPQATGPGTMDQVRSGTRAAEDLNRGVNAVRHLFKF